MREALPGIEALRPADGPLLVAVGVFDGLHRGHLYLLRELRRAARRLDARAAVLTFDHPPGRSPRRRSAPAPLRPRRAPGPPGARRRGGERRGALRRCPATHHVRGFRGVDPGQDLAGRLPHDARCRLRPRAARDAPDARRAGEARGFRVVVVAPFDLGGRPVRSTEIRSAIAAGDLAAARTLLGRRVAVTGPSREERIRARGCRPLPDSRRPAARGPVPGRRLRLVGSGPAPGTSPPGDGPRRASGLVRVTAHPEALRHDRLRIAFVGRAG